MRVSRRIRSLFSLLALVIFMAVAIYSNGFGLLKHDPYAIKAGQGDIVDQLVDNNYALMSSETALSSDNGSQTWQTWKRGDQTMTVNIVGRKLDTISSTLPNGEQFWCTAQTQRLDQAVPAFRWALFNLSDDNDFAPTVGYPYKGFQTTVDGKQVNGDCYRGRLT